MMTKYEIKTILVSMWILALAAACGEKKPQPKPEPLVKVPAPAVDTAAADENEPPPPPPTGRPVLAYRDGKITEMREPQAVEAGLTVIDLSNYWVPFIFSERDTPDGERLRNEFRPIFRKLANDWHYESRTRAAAREIVERHRARVRRARIAQMRDEGASEEEIAEVFGLDTDGKDEKDEKEGAGKDEKEDAGKDEKEDAGKDDGERFEGGLGEAQNFLEVYGIPPSLSVLRKRALEEVGKPCFEEIDYDRIKRYDGFIAYRSRVRARAESRKGRVLSKKMRREMERLEVDDPLALKEKDGAKIAPGSIDYAIRYEALAEAQKLLKCELLYDDGEEAMYWAGGLDWKTQQALLAFEQKNRIFGWGYFGKATLAALQKSPAERLYDTFLRVLAERIVEATHIIEDGSAVGEDGEPATYVDDKGETVPVPNLVEEYTDAVIRHMDLTTPKKVVEFLKSHDDDSLDRLYVAIPLPELPPYYSEVMELSAEIDRGDVWYEYPYTMEGKRRGQPRRLMPVTTLFVTWRGQKIPLVTMNTTIGGWRTEVGPDGYEYFKYKNSDVGERVWRDIVAGPVWLPPTSTPADGLIKTVTYRGRKVTVPNYDEFGPWYASAYGLVAAFHVRPVERKDGSMVYFDNGIRSHGSVDYNSILRRFSHGCHRLYNHMAIRLFDFVLRHRPYTRVGQILAGFSRRITVTEDGGEGEEPEEESYVITLDSKGYKYELVEPVPVRVTSGRIRGRQRTPIEHFMPKPGVEYGADAEFLPEEYREQQADAGASEEEVIAEPDTEAEEQPAEEKPEDTPAEEKPEEQPAEEKPEDTPAEKPEDTPAEKPEDTPAEEKPEDTPAEKPEDTLAEKPEDTPAEE